MLLKNQQQRISEVARKAFTTPTAAYPRLLLPYTLCAYCISLSSFSLLHPNFMMIYFTDGQEQQLSLIQRIIEMLQYIYSRWNMRRNAFTRNDRGGCSNISATTYHLHSKACTYISKYANLAKCEKAILEIVQFVLLVDHMWDLKWGVSRWLGSATLLLCCSSHENWELLQG